MTSSRQPRPGLTVEARTDVTLTWDYAPGDPRLATLYEQAKRRQWNASTDVDWSTPVDFGGPLPPRSAYAERAFAASPLSRYGSDGWTRFQWEFQSWMVSQFLHGEQGALVASARLAEMLPDLTAKAFAATQAVDEARHVEVFSRYLCEHVPEPYTASPPLACLLADVLGDSRWDIVALGMQIMVEAVAMAAFRMANASFHDPLILDITQLVIRDEARHVSFGILAMEPIATDLTNAELAEREEFLEEAADLIVARFMLEDIWDRLEIDRDAGVAFARHDELMVRYRQTIFSKVLTSLSRIGMLTPRVLGRFDRLGLVGERRPEPNRRPAAQR